MSVVALWSPLDVLTSIVTPIGLAATRPSSLVIDLDPNGPTFGGDFSLADLVRDGPTRAQLEPHGRTVAVLANGGVGPTDAAEVVSAFAERWPSVVLRCDPRAERPAGAVPIVPLLPAPLSVSVRPPVVFQSMGFGISAPAGSFVLPKPSAPVIASLVDLKTPTIPSRWLRQLSSLWKLAT